jgi:hypothetical protein
MSLSSHDTQGFLFALLSLAIVYKFTKKLYVFLESALYGLFLARGTENVGTSFSHYELVLFPYTSFALASSILVEVVPSIAPVPPLG